MPAHTRRATSRGYGISYEDVGTGFPIVLINGFSGRAAEWRNLGFVDRLAPPYRVLSVDSLGHGLSDAPHGWDAYQAPMIGEDIVAAMDDAGVGRTALWGYSRGARLAAMIASEYPERVAALIVGGADLITPADPEIPATTDALCRGDWDAFWEAFGEVSDRDRTEIMLCDPRALGAVDIASRRSAYVLDLGRIVAPTLLYCGGGDEPIEEMDATAAALGVPVTIVGDGDHWSTFTDVDALVPLVLGHLERVEI